MPLPSVGVQQILIVGQWLQKYPELTHIRIRIQGKLLILESGPKDDPIRHIRFRRAPSGHWTIEMPHRSRWQTTPIEDLELEPLLDLVRDDFGWMLMKIE